jgi:hypothetical protein
MLCGHLIKTHHDPASFYPSPASQAAVPADLEAPVDHAAGKRHLVRKRKRGPAARARKANKKKAKRINKPAKALKEKAYLYLHEILEGCGARPRRRDGADIDGMFS